MKIQKKFFLFFLVTVIGFFVINEYLTSKYSIEEFREASYKQSKINLKTILDLQMKSAEVIAINISNDEVVKQAYLKNNPDLIIKHLNKFWHNVKSKELIYEIHFFKPPAISFVNFSNFGSIGRDVSEVRKDIVWITTSFKSSKHIMMCKTYAGIRATYPIFSDDGHILGGLSLGKKLDWLPATMKQISGNNAFLLYSKNATKSLAPKYLDNFMIDKQYIGEYILADKTMAIPSEFIASLDVRKKTQSIMIQDNKYLLNLYPIYDFEKNIMAYVGTLHNYQSIYDRIWSRISFNFIFIFIFFIGILYLGNRYIKNMLSRINDIYKLTQQYKNREFHTIKLDKKESTTQDEVSMLKTNVLEMGATLHQNYIKLEESIDKKTKEIQEAYKSLESTHYEDTLTKLPNRFALIKDLNEYNHGTFIIFDIKRFKVINDTYGIEIGNQLLLAISEFILKLSKEQEISIYRVGSDEFASLSKASLEECQEWLEYVFIQIEREIFIFSEGAIEISIELNAGISIITAHCLEHATLALGYAKEHNLEYFVYSENLQNIHSYKADTVMIKKIKLAILNDRVIPYFQAIVDVDGKIKKYEALMRLKIDDKILAPNEFLEVVKHSKFYHAMTRIMIQKSLELFRDRDEGVSINLNTIDIKNTTTVMLILDELKRFPDTNRVTFELVESESMQNVSEVLNFIVAIKTLGAKIAIDDFGTGYSNFSYLMEMNPDFIKIDGSLISNIDKDEQAYTIVKSIVEFTHALGIESIGEYIYSKEIFDKAKSLGIDSFQGYYFHQPEPLRGS